MGKREPTWDDPPVSSKLDENSGLALAEDAGAPPCCCSMIGLRADGGSLYEESYRPLRVRRVTDLLSGCDFRFEFLNFSF